MEAGESSRKEVSWIPTTPLKPVLPGIEPICADGDGNQLSQTKFLKTSSSWASPHASYTESVVACAQPSSSGAGLYMKMHDQVESTSALTSIGSDSAVTCAKPTDGDVSGWGFVNLLALAEAASQHSNPPGTNNEAKNSVFPDSNSQSYSVPNHVNVLPSHHNAYLEQTQVDTNNCIPQEPQGTSSIASQTSTSVGFSGKTISYVAPPTPDKAIRGETRQVLGMQITVELEKNVPSINSETPDNRELSETVTESSLAAVFTPLKENHNPDKGGSHVVDLNQTPTPKQRRKKHRPKVIKEGKPKSARKPVTPKPAQPKENSTGQRKNGLNKASTPPPADVTVESTESIMPGSTKKSCRKSLNFELTEQPGDETTVPTENVTLQIRKGTGVLEETRAAASKSLANINTPEAMPNALSAKNHKRKGVVVTARDGHENSETQSKHNNSNSSKTGNLTAGLHIGGTKRKHSTTADHADTSHMNLIGVHYNGLHAYQNCWVQFPDVQKKRRSEKVSTCNNTSRTSSSSTKDLQLATYPYDLHASSSECLISCEYNAVESPVTFEAMDRATHGRSQAFESIISFSQTMPTKRRSKSKIPTKFHDFARFCDYDMPTTTRNCDLLPNQFTRQQSNSDMQPLAEGERPITSIDTLVAEKMHVSFKKKRTARENRKKLATSTFAIPNQMHHDILLSRYQPSWTMSLDAGHQKPNNMQIMEALAEKFRHLDINVRATSSHEPKALIPYKQQNQKDKITQGHGAVIPYEGAFDPIRKRLPRPKVDLDEETDKVWKLLMLDINSHGIDGTDEEKAKWWEEERRVFRGRADSFIARMHLVQGDRRFSRWKGSVVDSVIGVFLTQNVSDHLSSSAFMSLAARFPLKASKCKTYHEETISLFANEPQAFIIEPEENTKWDDKMLSQPVCCQISPTKDVSEHSEEKEALNSNDSPGTTSLADESNCIQWKSSDGNTREHHSSMSKPTGTIITLARQEKLCYGETEKELTGVVSSPCSAISSQISEGFSVEQNSERIGSSSDSNSEAEDLSSIAKHNIVCKNIGFSTLLEMINSGKFYGFNSPRIKSSENPKAAVDLSRVGHDKQSEDLEKSDVIQVSLEESMIPSSDYTLNLSTNSVLERQSFDSLKMEAHSSGSSNDKDQNNMNKSSSQARKSKNQAAISQSAGTPPHLLLHKQSTVMQQILLHSSAQTQDLIQKAAESNSEDQHYVVMSQSTEIDAASIKPKGGKPGKDKTKQVDWDNLRIQAQLKGGKREKTADTMDSLDWDAVRCANVHEIADAIKERGMNNMLAERIKDFLDRLVKEHGGIDLEWLRDVPPDRAKEYLLSVRGLGLKSVECVRLLTLHHLAFPVDTNVGRIAVRLGWVPLQPLPESLQLHLLELYPVLESIQKYLWPRLCKLDQKTLYELHYQMITFGKVFCTKSKPNCNACPMRGECRHFASAFASARLALPGPEQRSMVSTSGNSGFEQNPSVIVRQSPLPLPENTTPAEENEQKQLEAKSGIVTCEPIIEEPATPETECTQMLENDIEDAFYEDASEIPTIKLNIEEFTLNLQNYMHDNKELQDGMSKALVALTPEAASIPTPKLKNVSRLRTEHHVYELPDSHPLLEGWERREPDDPCKYLLAIWTPGETANSILPPESRCSFQGDGQLCNEKECFSCNSIREADSQIVRGTILIPCRTAMRGSFPLNGTYFQVNEVFADHVTSLDPIHVPRSLIWNLNRRTVYFGTSIPSIFKGLSTQEIQQCFWRGFVCVRGFERETRAPRPLMARLHFPASKLVRSKEKSSGT